MSNCGRRNPIETVEDCIHEMCGGLGRRKVWVVEAVRRRRRMKVEVAAPRRRKRKAVAEEEGCRRKKSWMVVEGNSESHHHHHYDDGDGGDGMPWWILFVKSGISENSRVKAMEYRVRVANEDDDDDDDQKGVSTFISLCVILPQFNN